GTRAYGGVPGPEACLLLRHYGPQYRLQDAPPCRKSPDVGGWAFRKVLRARPGTDWYRTGSVELDIKNVCVRLDLEGGGAENPDFSKARCPCERQFCVFTRS